MQICNENCNHCTCVSDVYFCRLHNAAYPDHPVFSLTLLHVLSAPLHGLANALVFGKDTWSQLSSRGIKVKVQIHRSDWSPMSLPVSLWLLGGISSNADQTHLWYLILISHSRNTCVFRWRSSLDCVTAQRLESTTPRMWDTHMTLIHTPILMMRTTTSSFTVRTWS